MKKFLALIAALLCLSMLFVSCKKADESSDDEDATDPDGGKGVVYDTAGDIAKILDYLAANKNTSADQVDMTFGEALGELKTLYADLEFALTDCTLNGQKMCDSTFKDGKFVFNAQVDGDYSEYLIFDENYNVFNVSKTGTGYKAVVDNNINDTIAQFLAMPSDTPLTELMGANDATLELVDKIPMPEASSFEHKGKGVYALTKNYLLDMFLDLAKYVSEQEGQGPTEEEFAEAKTELEKMFADIDIVVEFTVASGKVTTLNFGVAAGKAGILKLYGGSEENLPAGEDLWFKAYVEFDLAKPETSPINLVLDFRAVTGRYGFPDGNEAEGIGFTEFKVDASVNLSKLGAANADVLDLTMKQSTEYKYYDANMVYDEALTAEEGSTQTLDLTADLKTGSKVGMLELTVDASATYNGESQDFDFVAKAQFVDVTAPKLPSEVTAYESQFANYLAKRDEIDAKIAQINDGLLTKYANEEARLQPHNTRIYLADYGITLHVDTQYLWSEASNNGGTQFTHWEYTVDSDTVYLGKAPTDYCLLITLNGNNFGYELYGIEQA